MALSTIFVSHIAVLLNQSTDRASVLAVEMEEFFPEALLEKSYSIQYKNFEPDYLNILV